jgi:hypothetical protein
MANKNNEKTYWPHMILGFLALGITLSYWTVKSASSIPVQESNEYMLKYQQADININEIIKRKMQFDKNYEIKIMDVQTAIHKIENSKAAKQSKAVVLSNGKNSFTYLVATRDGTPVLDANVTFLLTRPHTVQDDLFVENVPVANGNYHVRDINISKPGRYTLQLRAKVGDDIGYSHLPAYLKPQ